MQIFPGGGKSAFIVRFKRQYERGLSAAGENLHAPECSFSPAAESPRSYCRLNRTMNADLPPPEKNCIQVDANFHRRRKVRVHSSIQTTVVRFKRQYIFPSVPLQRQSSHFRDNHTKVFVSLSILARFRQETPRSKALDLRFL